MKTKHHYLDSCCYGRTECSQMVQKKTDFYCISWKMKLISSPAAGTLNRLAPKSTALQMVNRLDCNTGLNTTPRSPFPNHWVLTLNLFVYGFLLWAVEDSSNVSHNCKSEELAHNGMLSYVYDKMIQRIDNSL